MAKRLNHWYHSKSSVFEKSDFRSKLFSGAWQRHFINVFVDEVFGSGTRSAINNCADYKAEHFPSYLYKFYSPNMYSLINMESGKLWLSSPEQFNDPFDSFVGVDEDAFCKMKLANELKKEGKITSEPSADTLSEQEYWHIRHAYTGFKSSSIQKEQARLWKVLWDLKTHKSEELNCLLRSQEFKARNECREKLSQLRNSVFRVACFANFKDDDELAYNTTMWSHYAAEHTGFCLKYKLDFNNFPSRNELKCGLYPVKYSTLLPKASPTALLKAKTDEHGQLTLNAELTKTIYKALVVKSKFWNYEKEWRLILNRKSDMITNGNIEFPFVEAVYLGCRMEASIREYITAWAKRNGLPIYQAKKHNERYALDFINL